MLGDVCGPGFRQRLCVGKPQNTSVCIPAICIASHTYKEFSASMILGVRKLWSFVHRSVHREP